MSKIPPKQAPSKAREEAARAARNEALVDLDRAVWSLVLAERLADADQEGLSAALTCLKAVRAAVLHEGSWPVSSAERWERLQRAAKRLGAVLPGEETRSERARRAGRLPGRCVPGEAPIPADATGDMRLALEEVRNFLRQSRPPATAARLSLRRRLGNPAFEALTSEQIAAAFQGATLAGGPGRGKRGPVAVLTALAASAGLKTWTRKKIEDAGRPRDSAR